MPDRPTSIKECLRVDFTSEERLKMGAELAESHDRFEAIDAEEAVVKARFKDRRTTIQQRIGELSRNLRTGFTMQDVECTVKYDDPNPNEVSYYRNDNGTLVRTRPFSATERQQELPLSDAAAETSVLKSAEAAAEFFDSAANAEATPAEVENQPSDTPDEFLEIPLSDATPPPEAAKPKKGKAKPEEPAQTAGDGW